MADPKLSAAVQAHRTLVEQVKALYPDEDEATLADTIEGLTDLDAVVCAVLRDALWREEQADAVQRMIDKLRGRKDRLEHGAETLRNAALEVMQEAGMGKVWAADLSASIGQGPARVIVTDEAAIPDSFMRVTKAPNKTAIGEMLRRGGEVPGCNLSNRPSVLRVRRD
jgi:hypothetical protein